MSTIGIESDWTGDPPTAHSRAERTARIHADAAERAQAVSDRPGTFVTSPCTERAHRYDDRRLANTERVVTVTDENLPAGCPPPGTCLWSSHPRVYLPLGRERGAGTEARCPYCSTLYVLGDGRRGSGS